MGTLFTLRRGILPVEIVSKYCHGVLSSIYPFVDAEFMP